MKVQFKSNIMAFALLFAASGIVSVFGGGLSPAFAYDVPTSPVDKIRICHATGNPNNYTNPEVSTSAVNNLFDFNGHGSNVGTHGGDIIPPFTNTDGVEYNGKNWDARGIAIYANNCEVPENQIQYFLQTSHSNDVCGEITVTLRNFSPWMYRVLIEEKVGENWVRVLADEGNPWMVVPGVMQVDNRGEAPDDQTGTYTVRFAEDSGLRELRYKVSSGTEQDLYVGLPVGEFTYVNSIITDCEQPEVPVDPEKPVDEDEKPAPVSDPNVLGDTDTRGGAGELPTSLPVTGANEQLAAIVTIVSTIATAAGVYAFRGRSADLPL